MSYEINEIPDQEITEPVSLEFQKAWSRVDAEVEMPESTAKALIAHKVVEEAGKKKAK